MHERDHQRSRYRPDGNSSGCNIARRRACFSGAIAASILSRPGDWGGAIAEEVGILIRRTFAVISIVVVLGITWSYWKDAQLRAICDPSQRNSERSPHGGYWARYCYFGDTIVLRLYDEGGERLIVERTYRDTSGIPVKLHWGKEALMYREERDLGEISLPPTFLDTMLARLP